MKIIITTILFFSLLFCLGQSNIEKYKAINENKNLQQKKEEKSPFSDIQIKADSLRLNQKLEFRPRETDQYLLNYGKQNNAIQPVDYLIRGSLNFVPKIKIKLGSK